MDNEPTKRDIYALIILHALLSKQNSESTLLPRLAVELADKLIDTLEHQ